MSIVKYGEWEIDVDAEKTKQYYYSLEVAKDSQTYRNFAKYCESLTDGEREFFDSFAINPLLCDIYSPGTFKKYLPCGGHYYVYGKYISTPREILWTVEQLAENNFVDDLPDPRITVGAFQFDFQNPENEFHDIPDDMPEGCICINFWCEEMLWLLDEKCELQSIEPPKFWQIGRKIKEWKASREAQKEYRISMEEDVISSFSKAGITFEEMDEKEVHDYKKRWLSEYAPQNAEMSELTALCVGSRKFTSFLWHLFSYEYVQACSEDQAATLFDKQPKDSAVIIENTESLGYRISNLSGLNSEFLSEWTDVTVTATDFSWTYSKTHEAMIGPYYYSPSKEIKASE